MALSKLTITNGQWKKLSNAGQNGKAWMKTVGSDGSSRVIISHTPTAQTAGSPIGDNIPVGSAINLDAGTGYILPLNGDPLLSDILAADNSSDIYYATLLDAGETCEIIVDFV